ncbi:MAG: ADP-ribosylglycohydrolase family protein, partial [Deltaproteobacteria bacterium]|nr:ADP-ribosylglycohydrolase family protein [Deltaproteobacteria bacterium]
KGDFTHYGDQTLLLLETIASRPGFDLDHFSQAWQAFFQSYDGYVDKATQTTLENFSAGKAASESGSDSTDLGGAARIAPLVYWYGNNETDLVTAARSQTIMTHHHPGVVEAAVFFSKVMVKILEGAAPTAAIDQVTENAFANSTVSDWVRAGQNSVNSDTLETIADFGQMCTTSAAFPSVIHLITKYENNLKDALVENVMAGGDSAARGMITGMVLGAHLGMDAIPKIWLSELSARDRIEKVMERSL